MSGKTYVVVFLLCSIIVKHVSSKYCAPKIYCINESPREIRKIDEISADFRLYTKPKEGAQNVSAKGSKNWTDSDIPTTIKQGKTVFLIHGFGGGEKKADWIPPMKDALLSPG